MKHLNTNGRRLLLMLMLCLPLFSHTVTTSQAQCGIHNTAFKSGEYLSYDLYFNWKFVWVKVGTASMSLLCYTTTDITPLYYRKGAREGKRYYVDELWYSYPKGNSHLKMHRIDADGKHHWKQAEYKDCIYDMMSIFLRARNFDTSKLRKGENIPMPISDARHLSNSWLKYGGKTTLKMKNSNAKFRCLIFSFIEREDGKNHELIRFFVTDDKNHLPVRLDMFLSFGSAKAYLTGMKGLRNELTSKEK